MRLHNFFFSAMAGMAMITACAANPPTQTMSGVLTNMSGMTLYVFDKDPADASKSACNGECAMKWPPLMASDSDKASGNYSIVTRDDVPDPHVLRLTTRVNGETKQDSNTRYMIFDIPATIAALSAGLTLEPGDVIATGTPDGVGFARTPPEFLKPGDVVEAEVEGVGVLRNPVVDRWA